jgi:hypothetical protein
MQTLDHLVFGEGGSMSTKIQDNVQRLLSYIAHHYDLHL